MGNEYLNILLRDYNQRLEMEQAEMATLPEGRLSFRTDGLKTNYILLKDDFSNSKQRYSRRTINNDVHLIRKLARKEYLKTSTAMLSDEITRLEDFLKNSKPPDVRNILEAMPKRFRMINKELFFSKMADVDEWLKADYEINQYKIHEKIHTTSRGLKVRSKSELLIAEKLDYYCIPYRYEQMIYFERYSFSPDFTIWTTNGIIYWEHCGLMSDPEYKKSNQWKLRMYDKMDIVPWKNLIVTYDTDDGGINAGIIDAEIRNRILPFLAK